MDKEMFEEMIMDWQADNAPEYDDLEIEEIKAENGKLIAIAHDEKSDYQLSDDGAGNIVINYLSTGWGGNRSGAGRPPVEDKRTSRSIKFSDAEWETVKQKADAAGTTISEYVREKALNCEVEDLIMEKKFISLADLRYDLVDFYDSEGNKHLDNNFIGVYGNQVDGWDTAYYEEGRNEIIIEDIYEKDGETGELVLIDMDEIEMSIRSM